MSCTEPSDCCINVMLSIDVELQNADGVDLLNSTTPGFIAKKDTRVYYEIRGKLETYRSLNTGAMLDNPEGFAIQNDGIKYFLHVFSNPTVGNNIVTLIRIKDRPEIRLVTKVESNHGKQVTELRYNDQLVWANSMSSQQGPIVTIKFD